MKYLCPTILEGILKEQAELLDKYSAINTTDAESDMESVRRKRADKEALKLQIEAKVKATTPL
eukprot:2984586-Pleurochrysis_carterae.AAC.1